VGGGDEQVLDVVVFLHVHAGDADPAPALLAVGRQRQRLDVARVGDRDHHLLVGDQVLDVDLALGVDDLGPPLVAVGLGDLRQFLLDQGQDPRLVAEDLPQFLDPLNQVGVLLLDLVRLERGQTAQSELEDGLGLHHGQFEPLDQAGARDLGGLRPADQRDDLVEIGKRDQQPLQHVCALLGPAKLVLGAPDDDLALVVDVVADHLTQRQRARHVVDQRDDVHAERLLHRRVLEQLVQHHLGDRVALELDNDPHPVAVRLVPDIADLGDLLVVHERGDLLDHPAVPALAHLERQLGDDDRLLALADRLDVRLGLHADAPASRRIGVADSLPSQDRPGGREVRALDVLHQTLDVDVGVVDVGKRRRHYLAQVVRRDVGRHADGDPRPAVDEQVREARGQDERLLLGAVEVRCEVDRLLIDVAQHLGRQRVEPGLGVAHRRRAPAVDVPEVPVPVDERVAHREVLRHPGERVVDGRVAVRVVLPHHLADDRGALDVPAGRPQAELVHRVEDPAVDGLEAVPDVGQRTPDDHRHGVVEIRRAHLVLEPARLDVAAADGVDRCH
jgi:hypothetical protein